MKYIKIILKLLINFKFEILKPTYKKFLIFDNTNSDLIKKYLKSKYAILYTRNEKFNLFVLLQNFLKGKFNKKEYLESYIKFVNPKIIITTVDNNPFFYELQKQSYQKKILLQTAWKYPLFDFNILDYKKKKKIIKNNNFNLDIAIVYNKHIGEIFKNFNTKKIIQNGSLKSNHHKINKKKEIDLVFISCWANVNFSENIADNFSYKQFFDKQEKVLFYLGRYSDKYNLNLHILGKRDDNELEFNYYNNIFKNKIKWKFLEGKKYNPYKIVDSSKIVFNLYSTLGYEALSRGNKTIFFNPYKKTFKNLNFGWPCEHFKSEGPFWTEKINYNNIEKTINFVRFMNKKKFLNLRKKYIQDLMIYRSKNSQLKRILLDLN